MKLVVTAFVTLDGVMRAPGGSDEDRSGGFAHGGWLVPFFDADLGQFMQETFAQADAFLLGRTTYDLMQPCWSTVTDAGNAVGVALNTLPRHVATHRPASLTWQPSYPLDGDVCAAVEALKCKPGRELQVHGSHGLVQSLLRANLVDLFNLITFPVLVGAGKRLFGDGAMPRELKLTNIQTSTTGVTMARYRVAGDVKIGSFALKKQ